jgi:UDP-glucuronate 4-epimerase
VFLDAIGLEPGVLDLSLGATEARSRPSLQRAEADDELGETVRDRGRGVPHRRAGRGAAVVDLSVEADLADRRGAEEIVPRDHVGRVPHDPVDVADVDARVADGSTLLRRERTRARSLRPIRRKWSAETDARGLDHLDVTLSMTLSAPARRAARTGYPTIWSVKRSHDAQERLAVTAGKKILVTGGTGTVLFDAVLQLAAGNEVWCLARYTDAAKRAELERAGVRTFAWDTGNGDLERLPRDFELVFHAARAATGQPHHEAIRANCVGVAQLMTHGRDAEAFVFVSSTAVYTPVSPDHVHVETDPTGGYSPGDPPYAIGKIAGEGTARALAEVLGIPTLIARMNIGYGPHGWGGLPVRYYRHIREGLTVPLIRADGATWMTPIHSDDCARQVPLLLSAAAVPARIVNWGGDHVVSEREVIEWIGSITGRAWEVVEVDNAGAPCAADSRLRRKLIGDCTVHWREGIAATIAAHFPGEVDDGVLASVR